MKIYTLEEAQELGFVKGTTLVRLRYMSVNGNFENAFDDTLVIPYGVDTIDDSIGGMFFTIAGPQARHFSKVYIPDTLRKWLNAGHRDLLRTSSLITYHDINDLSEDKDNNIIDLSELVYCSLFPPIVMYGSTEIIVNPDITFEGISHLDGSFFYSFSRPPIVLARESQLYDSMHGALYSKGMKTLLYHPLIEKGSSLTFDPDVEVIGEHACYGAISYESNVSIPSTIRQIKEGAFWDSRPGAVLDLSNSTAVIESPETFASADTTLILPNHLLLSVEEFIGRDGHDGLICVRDSQGSGFVAAAYAPRRENIKSSSRFSYAPSGPGEKLRAIDQAFSNNLLELFSDKYRVAITRLFCGGVPELAPSTEMQDVYRRYIKRFAKRIVTELGADTPCNLSSGMPDSNRYLDMLRTIGFHPEEILHRAKGKAKKKSVAVLSSEAIDAMKEGDASKLELLEPIASKVRPAVALELLILAADKSTGTTIDRLYRLFGAFEMPGLALFRAINRGNESAARALLAHGAAPSLDFKPLTLRGDTPSKQENRKKSYLEEVAWTGALFGQHHYWTLNGLANHRRSAHDLSYHIEHSVTADALPVLVSLISDGLIDDSTQYFFVKEALTKPWSEEYSDQLHAIALNQLKYSSRRIWSLIEASIARHPEVGRELYLANTNSRPPKDWFKYGEGYSYVTRYTENVAYIMPELLPSFWRQSMLNYPKTIGVMIRYLDPKTFKNSVASLNALAKAGDGDAIRVMVDRGFKISPKTLSKAASLAQENGNTETAAIILSLLGDDGEGGADLTL